jgi:hypothetical protein
MPLSNHPEVFACLGMVIGLYGVLYLEVARVPERNWPVAAVGMAGKVLGPLGFAQLVLSGAVLHLAIPRQAEAATTVAAQIAKANAPNAAASRWSTGTSTASS